jgi:alpha-glucosidase (family GH31 glycosyl hydrolase)
MFTALNAPSAKCLALTFSLACLSTAVAAPCFGATSATVRAGNARFTIITPNLIRMEYQADGKFVDQPSLFAAVRSLTPPPYKLNTTGNISTITTPSLTLKYVNNGKPFAADNLEISVLSKGKSIRWVPGTKDTGNLGGTIRTLDGAKGPMDLGQGVISRSGWSLFDDSQSPVLTTDGWVQSRPDAQKAGKDWYFFGYGSNYRAALSSLTKVSGQVPLPRRYALGVWYSRYWPWSESDYKNIVNRYAKEDFPLDVVVLDMDWHKDGWTGWSWNKKLLPDAPGLLSWMHSQNLRCTLNLHPADGVAPHEDHYADFMKALNRDPASKETIPFDAGNKKYTDALFSTILNPLKKDGVDFWWLDWQQYPNTRSIADLTNLFWLNQLIYNYTSEAGQRGMSFSRWGGPGDQRHPIHFSGDADTGFPMLAFEVPFTSTAGNVGCFFWSHDIGGHQGGRNEESYARWCQFGASSAALRSHSTRNATMDRAPWTYPKWAEDSMRASYHLRSQLFPYIYTSAVEACKQSIPLTRPLYLDLPENENAYHNGQEFLLGDNLLVAPIAAAGAGKGHVSYQAVWLPPTESGYWYNLLTGERETSSSNILAAADINEFPIYARGGVPVPMQPYTPRMSANQAQTLTVRCYPGRDGQTGQSTLYEDDGVSTAYKKGESATTTLVYKRSGSSTKISISPSGGHFKGQPLQRSYIIELPDTAKPKTVKVNSQAIKFSYDPKQFMTTITVKSLPGKQAVTVLVDGYQPEGWDKLHENAARARLSQSLNASATLPNIPKMPAAALARATSPGEKVAVLASAGLGVAHKNTATYFYPESYQDLLFVPHGLTDGNKVTLPDGSTKIVPPGGINGLPITAASGQDKKVRFSIAGNDYALPAATN